MSVTTKIQSAGLVRDSAPALASDVNALRQAEHVVVRSPGVIESRPNFDLVVERTGTNDRVKALHEFNGDVIAVSYDSVSPAWSARDATTNTAITTGTFTTVEPPDNDKSESRFMEARQSLYVTGKYGPVALESTTSAARVAGVMCPPMMTDYDSTPLTNSELPSHSHAYRFVIVREDSNGYIRRSPPSQRFVCMNNWPLGTGNGTYASGTRVYLGVRASSLLAAGDKVEAYRTRQTAGLEPRPEHYLAWTYVLTSGDISNKYFDPPDDTTLDDDLGAQLYTDIAQGSETAAKYPPPQAKQMSFWQRCAWYSDVVERKRITIDMNHFFRAGAGIPRLYFRNASYSSGSTTVTVASTSGLEVGMRWTDNLVQGPTVAGTYVPANTYIASITDGTHFVMSAAALAGAPDLANSAVMTAEAPAGIIAEKQTGTYTSGLATVTGLTDTSMMRVGMYWTDNQYGPALANGAKVRANTKILTIDSSTQITMDKTALATGASLTYYGDVITIEGLDFYAWISYAGALTPPDPWTFDASNHYFNCFAIGDPTTGISPRWVAAINLEVWLAHACNGLGSANLSTATTRVIGDFTLGPGGAYVSWSNGQFIPPGIATSVVVEELLPATGLTFATSCTCPAGIGPENPMTPDPVSWPNRVYFSDVDEPESVPLVNYFDVGSQGARVLALVPLRNALLVFKEDGLWRVTGSGPTAWSVDLLDPTIRLIRPEAVCASNNKAYAWCLGGFMEIDENGGRSLSQSRIDVELREIASSVMDNSTSHGVWCIPIQTLNLVLLGVPSSGGQSFTSMVYVYNQSTDAFTEWPFELGPAADSATKRTCYVSRSTKTPPAGCAAVEYEVRELAAPRGYDRTYSISDPTSVSGTTITFDSTGIGQWWPVVGDFISSLYGGRRVYRRITAAVYLDFVWTFTLESLITGSDGSDILADDGGALFVDEGGVFISISATNSSYQAHEAAILGLEWHPTAPSGIPVGAIARELQFQMDLRDVPSESVSESLPRYVIGASSERDTAPTTVVCNADRVASIQPVRAGVSRQVARAALLAPYMQTSDVFPLRVVGGSIVHEGTSEKTRR